MYYTEKTLNETLRVKLYPSCASRKAVIYAYLTLYRKSQRLVRFSSLLKCIYKITVFNG
jgi:hypothetical protein